MLLTLNGDAHWPGLRPGEGAVREAADLHDGDGVGGVRELRVVGAAVLHLGVEFRRRIVTLWEAGGDSV